MTEYEAFLREAAAARGISPDIANMRLMEEMSLSAEVRWEALRGSLQRLAGRPRRPHG